VIDLWAARAAEWIGMGPGGRQEELGGTGDVEKENGTEGWKWRN